MPSITVANHDFRESQKLLCLLAAEGYGEKCLPIGSGTQRPSPCRDLASNEDEDEDGSQP